MKMKVFVAALSLILFHLIPCMGQEQQDSVRTFRIETTDGNMFVGEIVKEDSSNVVILTESFGEITIPIYLLKSKKELVEVKKIGIEYWLPNPQSSRYFWAPNGYGLEKGDSYYQNIWVLYNQISLGVMNNFSVGAGTIPLFLFGGTSTPVWLVPKVSIPVVENKFNIGTGAFLGTLLGEDTGLFGLVFGTATIGSRDKNFSAGLAYGFSGDGWMQSPIINVSTMIRTGPKGYFISENYVISAEGETIVLISLGGRSIIRNVGLDYSLWIPVGSYIDAFVAIPFLGITIPIGKK